MLSVQYRLTPYPLLLQARGRLPNYGYMCGVMEFRTGKSPKRRSLTACCRCICLKTKVECYFAYLEPALLSEYSRHWSVLAFWKASSLGP
jgi:hypothetical protein